MDLHTGVSWLAGLIVVIAVVYGFMQTRGIANKPTEFQSFAHTEAQTYLLLASVVLLGLIVITLNIPL